MFKIFYGVLLSALILIVSIACEKEKEALYRYDSGTNQYENVLEKKSTTNVTSAQTITPTNSVSVEQYNALLNRIDKLESNVSNIKMALRNICSLRNTDIMSTGKVFDCRPLY